MKEVLILIPFECLRVSIDVILSNDFYYYVKLIYPLKSKLGIGWSLKWLLSIDFIWLLNMTAY